MNNTKPWYKMPVVWILFGAALLVGSAVAASIPDEAPEEPEETAVAETTPSAEPEPEEVIPEEGPDDTGVSYLRGIDADFEAVPDEMILDLFEATCQAFDEGATMEAVALTMLDSGLDEVQTGEVIGVAVIAHCPEYTSLLNEAADQWA